MFFNLPFKKTTWFSDISIVIYVNLFQLPLFHLIPFKKHCISVFRSLHDLCLGTVTCMKFCLTKWKKDGHGLRGAGLERPKRPSGPDPSLPRGGTWHLRSRGDSCTNMPRISTVYAGTFAVVSIAWVCRCLCVCTQGKSFKYPLGRQTLDLWKWYYLSQCRFVVNNIVEKSARKLILLKLKIDPLDNYLEVRLKVWTLIFWLAGSLCERFWIMTKPFQ